VTGLVKDAQLTIPRMTDGRVVSVPSFGIMLTDSLAKKLDVDLGESIDLVPTQGERRRLTVPVTAIVQSYVGMAAYANFHVLNRLIGEENSLNTVQAKVDNQPEILRQFYAHLKQMPKLQGFAAIREQKQQLKTLLAPVDTINSLLIIFAGLLCCGSIITASLISLSERRQEIATFRVLGYQPWQIGAVFWRESLLVNSFGIVCGLPIGYAFAQYIVNAVGTDTTRLPFHMDGSTWYLAIGLAYLFTAIGYLPVYYELVTMNWKEALSVKE
jgi:putative ABC transport system permease protein